MTPRLVETMRAERGRIALIDGHLARLERSAAYFGYAFDAPAVRAEVARALDAAPGAAVLRVRIELGARVDVSAVPFADPPLRTAWLCPEPLAEAGGALCLHKTTARAHYDRPLAAARARGADEAILVNAHGDLVEGTRTTLWLRLGGRWLTPESAAGGLPGVHRAHVLAARTDAGEARLRPADLAEAEAVVLANALRGASRVRVTGVPAPSNSP